MPINTGKSGSLVFPSQWQIDNAELIDTNGFPASWSSLKICSGFVSPSFGLIEALYVRPLGVRWSPKGHQPSMKTLLG